MSGPLKYRALDAIRCIYGKLLHGNAERFEATKLVNPNRDAKSMDQHLVWMLEELDRMQVLSSDVRYDGKWWRWFGFVQGVLWTRGCYTIEELRQHLLKAGRSEEQEPVVAQDDVNEESV